MGRTDRASLLIHVDRAEVFAALTDHDALLSWLAPQGMHAHFEQFDMREGGSYRLVLTYDDASDVSELHVTWVVPGQRLAQELVFESDDAAFQGTMQLEWSLYSSQDGTDVEVVARNLPLGVRPRHHAEGITSSLSNLATYLEP